MKRRMLLLAVVICLFASFKFAVAQNWQNYPIDGRGIPYFIAASNQTAIVASEGWITCCDTLVTVDALDLSTGSMKNLEQLGPVANLYSAVQFDNGMAVSVRDAGQNSFRIRHYSFSGTITDITPVGSTQLGALARTGPRLAPLSLALPKEMLIEWI